MSLASTKLELGELATPRQPEASHGIATYCVDERPDSEQSCGVKDVNAVKERIVAARRVWNVLCVSGTGSR